MNAQKLIEMTENGEIVWEYEGGTIARYRGSFNNILLKVSEFGTIYADGIAISQNHKQLFEIIKETRRQQVIEKLGWVE